MQTKFCANVGCRPHPVLLDFAFVSRVVSTLVSEVKNQQLLHCILSYCLTVCYTYTVLLLIEAPSLHQNNNVRPLASIRYPACI